AVDDHRAGAALRDAAAEFGAVELEVVPQHIEQRRLRRRRELVGLAVDVDGNRIRHEIAPQNLSGALSRLATARRRINRESNETDGRASAAGRWRRGLTK